MKNSNAWLHAFRLRTLPLSFSSIICGSAIAYQHDRFDISIFSLAMVTTLFLQILSNLANDYGDSKSGVDNEKRVGPTRAVQAGLISLSAMKNALIVFSVLSLAAGIALLLIAFSTEELLLVTIFMLFGMASVWSAIRYTVGKNPYGYSGFGDLFVFLFFGLLGVAGSYYLFIQELTLEVWLQGAAIGCFSTGVLNVNNMRDIENDKASGKHSIPVRLGLNRAKIYHYSIIIGGLLLTMAVLIPLKLWLVLAAFPFFILHIHAVVRKNSEQLDGELKKLSLATFFLSLLFFVNVLWVV